MRIDDDRTLIDLLTIDAAQRAELNPLLANATNIEFETSDEQDRAITLFGPGILAKSHVGPVSNLKKFTIQGAGCRFDQVMPTFDVHDAISDEAVYLRDVLRSSGFASTIFSPLIGSAALAEARPYTFESVRDADALIYHFGIGSTVSRDITALRTRRALWYHNITPPAFYRRYSPVMTRLLQDGLTELKSIVNSVDTLIADSEFNAGELARISDTLVDVVPFVLDFRRFDKVPDNAALPQCQGVRWLTVGRIAPNKGLLRLVRAFASFVRLYRDAQLMLVGVFGASDPFHLHLRFEIEKLGIADRVVFSGSVTAEALLAFYQSADIYVTLSEHEGFCVPLVEAMFFDLPIVASTAGAIPETLGNAGVMVEDEATSADIAALIEALLADHPMRTALIAAQRKRRAAFLPDAAARHLQDAVKRVLQIGGHVA